MTDDEYKRRLAANFDTRSLDYNPDNFHGKLAEKVVALARPQPGEAVLDVATGTGLAAISASRSVGASGKVVGWTCRPACWPGRGRPSRLRGRVISN